MDGRQVVTRHGHTLSRFTDTLSHPEATVSPDGVAPDPGAGHAKRRKPRISNALNHGAVADFLLNGERGLEKGRVMISTLRSVMAALIGVSALTGSAVAGTPPLASYHAVAVNMSNVGQRGLDTFDITVERWTTDEELGVLGSALLEKGSDALMDALQKTRPRVGYIRRSGGGLGWPLYFARKEESPSGGYRVVIATDRPMTFRERANNPRSADYDFLVAELRVGADGKGHGQLMPMARIDFDEASKDLSIEGYASEPVRLTQVTEQK
jgi:hypothetical protein